MYNLRNSIGLATALGGALMMIGLGAYAQPGPYGYHHWYQQNWQGTPYPVAPGMHHPYPGMMMPPPLVAPSQFAAMSGWGGNVMGVNSSLQDMGDYYLLQMRLPGVNANDLKMKIDGQVLSIAVIASSTQGSPATGQWGSFFQNLQQSITLPQPVNSAGMKGQFENGILSMMVPKAGRTLPGQ